MSARSTSSRSTSSRSTSVSSRSNGPANTSRSSSRSARRTGVRLAPDPDRSHAHDLADVGEGLGGDRLGLLGAGFEDPLELPLVVPELVVALAHRGLVLHHGVRHGLL